MHWFHDRSTLVKLLGTFAIICVLMVMVGYNGFVTAQGIQANLDYAHQNLLPTTVSLLTARVNIISAQRDIDGSLYAGTVEATQSLLRQFDQDLSTTELSWAAYKAKPADDNERALWTPYDTGYTAWKLEVVEARAQALANTTESNRLAREILSERAIPKAAALSKALDELLTFKVDAAHQDATDSTNQFETSVKTMLSLIVGGVALALGMGFFVARSVANPLKAMACAADALAQGDLDQDVVLDRHDEVGQMAAAFQGMISHQQRMASVATTIASGDLSSDVDPASDRDVLGQAFASMLRNLRQLVSQVSRSEERFRSLVQNASDATVIMDAEWRISYVSPASERVWGHAREELSGTSVHALVHPDDLGASQSFLHEALDHPSTNMTTELRLHHADGSWRDFEVVANNLLDQPAVSGIVLTGRDVTERRAFERQLQRLAFHDTLTGLPNRALLADRLERALARADRHSGHVAVLFIDLDNFKLINDGLGHEAGDRLLAAFADRLQGCLRSDDTAARLGGDEFIVLLDEVATSSEATDVADRIAALLCTPFSVGDREVIVTASIGVALSTPHHDRTESVLRNADLALYRAKAEGKARCTLFEASMERDALERLELETDLRQALGRDEFTLVYQPIVSLADGRILELEALVRWQHLTRGQISPVQFIPIAEEIGVIEPLGLWVLEEACRQAVLWQNAVPTDPPLVMSVNLSGRQFQDPKLVDKIAAVLRETGLAPCGLKLEITESVLMFDPEGTAATMHALTGLGVRFAIDDFGTGYSSLSYLRRFPVDTLKIDRSFVEGLGTDVQAHAIVRSIVALAKALSLSVTGEGVETDNQQAQLKELECDRGQGYLFARPLLAADVAGLLAQPLPHRAVYATPDLAA